MRHTLSEFKLSKFTIYFTLALGSSLAIPVSAQTAPDAAPAPAAQAESDSSDIEEVIVTARRVEERAQDVPLSMTLFSEAQLTKNNVVNATDLATITPSLSSNDNFGTENSTFAIRGFVQDQGTAPSVGVYFADVVAPRGLSNGVAVGDGAGPGNFFDLQNIQVLKGPQGTLQGRNTTGGSILFVPKKPTSELGGYVEAGGGNYDMYRVQGAANVPFGEKLRTRFAFDHQTRDGYLINNAVDENHGNSPLGPDNFNDVNYTSLRGSIVWDITPNIENYLIGSYSNSHTNGSVQKLIACNANPDPSANPLGGLLNGFSSPGPCGQVARDAARGDSFYTLQSDISSPHSKLQTWQFINTTTWHAMDALTAKNIISYAELKDENRSSLFGTDFRINDFLAPTAFSGETPIAFQTHILPFAFVQPPPGLPTAKESTFTEEIHLDGGAFDQRLTYQGGFYFESAKPKGQSGSQSPFLINCASPENLQCVDYIGRDLSLVEAGGAVPITVGAVNLTRGENSTSNKGIYTQVSYILLQNMRFVNQLKLTGGFRYTWDDQKTNSTRIGYTFPGTTWAGATPPFNDPTPSAACTDGAVYESAASCAQSLEAKSKAPTWLLDLDYKPTEDILTYVSYKRGYRSGGVFVNAPTEFNTFKPEKVDTGEVGLKTSFHGIVKGSFDVAAFYNYFRNQQLQVGFNGTPGSGNSSTTAIANAGASRIYGAEIGGSLNPFKGLVLAVDYTYLRTTIARINLPVPDPSQFTTTSQIEVGDALALSPSSKYSVSALYTLPLKSSLGKISGGPTFVHTNKQLSNYDYLHNPNTVKYLGGNWGTLNDRNILNAAASWDAVMSSGFDLTFFATNINHQKYYSFVAGLDGAGFESATLGEPTMYGGAVRYNFGN